MKMFNLNSTNYWRKILIDRSKNFVRLLKLGKNTHDVK